jgi:bifunctional polynucleotide phosphatase/kinase
MNIIKTSEYINIKFGDIQQKNKLAIFDLDSTIIITKSGKIHAQNSTDWKWLNNKTVELIQKLNTTHNVIIITNQKILNNETKINSWIDKITSIIEQLNISIEVFASLTTSIYRKPMTGFFEMIKLKYKFNLSDSFYCGDALGRKGDFSDVDYKFALNCGLKIKKPLDDDYKIQLSLDERNLWSEKYLSSTKPTITYPILPTSSIHTFKFIGKVYEMVLLIGMPASGKSSVARYIQRYNPQCRYEIINRDTLKTMKKCKDVCIDLIKKKCSIIIDNTNPSITARKEFIDIAKQNNYKVRAIVVNCSQELAMHNNIYRMTKTEHHIPEIVYNIYKKNYERPIKQEGITEIIDIDAYRPNDVAYFKYYY